MWLSTWKKKQDSNLVILQTISWGRCWRRDVDFHCSYRLPSHRIFLASSISSKGAKCFSKIPRRFVHLIKYLWTQIAWFIYSWQINLSCSWISTHSLPNLDSSNSDRRVIWACLRVSINSSKFWARACRVTACPNLCINWGLTFEQHENGVHRPAKAAW